MSNSQKQSGGSSPILYFVLTFLLAFVAGGALYHFALRDVFASDSEKKEAAAEEEEDMSVNTKTVKLATEKDSLAYAYGLTSSMGVMEYLAGQNVDTTKIDSWKNGVCESFTIDRNDPKERAYGVGLEMGMQLTNIFNNINEDLTGKDDADILPKDLYLEGFMDGAIKGGQKVADATEVITRLSDKVRSEANKGASKNKIAGEKYLEEKAKETGVKRLAGGVLYKVLKEGHGNIPSSTSKVSVKYEGRLIDGTVFDSSYERGDDPVSFGADQVIKGWTETLTHMPVGSVWEVYIPQDLAYGERDLGTIPPYSALIFKIELLSFE